MIAAALLLLAQATSVPAAPAQQAAGTDATRPQRTADGGERFSILAQPCGRSTENGQDVVVCGERADSHRLPLPDERPPPDHPMPSNPELTAGRALALQAVPCSASMSGCTVGVGPPPQLVQAAVQGIKDAVHGLRRKPDKRGRIPIPLDDPQPRPDAVQ